MHFSVFSLFHFLLSVIESKSTEATSTMRYFKSAAFLLALFSSSVPSLSRPAIAASEDPVPTPPTAELEPTGADLTSLLAGAQGKPNRALLRGVSERSPAPDFSQSPASFTARSAERSPISGKEVEAKPFDLESLRALMQTAPAEQAAPAFAQAPSEDLPTLEEDPAPIVPASEETPPASSSDGDLAAPSISAPEGPLVAPPSSDSPPEAPSGSSQPEIGDLPDSLLSDPNPLNVPTAPAEVDIERNPGCHPGASR